MRWTENAKLLIDAADEVEGLRIYGSPWVPFINGSWAFEEVWQGQLAEKFAVIPEGVDLRYALCGHIHTGDHNPIVLNHDDGSKTIGRNVSRLDEDDEGRFEPYVFEL